jgi:hypothetical protein
LEDPPPTKNARRRRIFAKNGLKGGQFGLF